MAVDECVAKFSFQFSVRLGSPRIMAGEYGGEPSQQHSSLVGALSLALNSSYRTEKEALAKSLIECGVIEERTPTDILINTYLVLGQLRDEILGTFPQARIVDAVRDAVSGVVNLVLHSFRIEGPGLIASAGAYMEKSAACSPSKFLRRRFDSWGITWRCWLVAQSLLERFSSQNSAGVVLYTLQKTAVDVLLLSPVLHLAQEVVKDFASIPDVESSLPLIACSLTMQQLQRCNNEVNFRGDFGFTNAYEKAQGVVRWASSTTVLAKARPVPFNEVMLNAVGALPSPSSSEPSTAVRCLLYCCGGGVATDMASANLCVASMMTELGLGSSNSEVYQVMAELTAALSSRITFSGSTRPPPYARAQEVRDQAKQDLIRRIRVAEVDM